MDNKLLSSLGKIAGVGGIALGVFLILFRGVLEKDVLFKSGLLSEQAFAVILALMILTFGIAGIGLISWLVSKNVGPQVPVSGAALGLLGALVVVVLGAAVYIGAHIGAHATPEPAPPNLHSRQQSRASDQLTVALLAGETQPLDGYHFASQPPVPGGLTPGPILPGGGRTRLVLQASDPDSIVEIDRISLVITRRDLSPEIASTFQYTVDPSRQPGFGGARPRRFYVQLNGNSNTRSFYLTETNSTVSTSVDNILAKTNFPVLRLDRTAGLQETLDFTFVAQTSGLYEIQFVTHGTSRGGEYDLQTTPMYIFRK